MGGPPDDVLQEGVLRGDEAPSAASRHGAVYRVSSGHKSVYAYVSSLQYVSGEGYVHNIGGDTW